MRSLRTIPSRKRSSSLGDRSPGIGASGAMESSLSSHAKVAGFTPPRGCYVPLDEGNVEVGSM